MALTFGFIFYFLQILYLVGFNVENGICLTHLCLNITIYLANLTISLYYLYIE